MAVGRTVFREFREVVIEGRVDYAVRRSRPGSEGVQILERTAIDSGACAARGAALHRSVAFA